ncbi:MAG: hypothetical protein ABSD71_05790 [Bacteroidales bacterium]
MKEPFRNKFFIHAILMVGFIFSQCTCKSIKAGENKHIIAKDQKKFSSLVKKYTREPLGGGEGYRKIVTKYDYIVRNKQELFYYLKKARSGEVIYLADTAVIDLTGENRINIPGRVTLASGRGRKESKGAFLFTNQLNTTLFITVGPGVKICGLRIFGPDTMRRTEQMKKLLQENGHKGYYSIPNSQGVESHFSNTEISNCEFSGWSHAAIFLVTVNKNESSENNYIHHNYIHHNQRSGLGYGICLDNAQAKIEGNIFNWNRHSIAGTGRTLTSYEACFNLILPDANGHAFDMHGGKDRGDSTDIAGKHISIHNNYFTLSAEPGVVIRGKPLEVSNIDHNYFENTDQTFEIKQVYATGNISFFENTFQEAIKK